MIQLTSAWLPAISAAVTGLITWGMMRQALTDFARRLDRIERALDTYIGRVDENARRLAFLEGRVLQPNGGHAARAAGGA